MREFWKKTIQVLLYGGLEKEQYKRISAEINEAEQKKHCGAVNTPIRSYLWEPSFYLECWHL